MGSADQSLSTALFLCNCASVAPLGPRPLSLHDKQEIVAQARSLVCDALGVFPPGAKKPIPARPGHTRSPGQWHGKLMLNQIESIFYV